MEVIVFPKVLDAFRDSLHENAVVVIDGRLSVREDEASKLLAESIVPIDNYDPARLDNGRPDPMKTAAKKLYIPCAFPQQQGICKGGQSAWHF